MEYPASTVFSVINMLTYPTVPKCLEKETFNRIYSSENWFNWITDLSEQV